MIATQIAKSDILLPRLIGPFLRGITERLVVERPVTCTIVCPVFSVDL